MKKLYILFAGLFFFTSITAQIRINEVMCSNTMHYDDVVYNFSDWIELYNSSGSSINIKNYYFSDDPDNPRKWQFKDSKSIASKKFLCIYFDKSGKSTNASFRLTPKGGSIYVYDSSGSLVDQISYPQLNQGNVSYGRTVDGTGSWKMMAYPTPAKTNTDGNPAEEYVGDPVFSETGEFFHGEKVITLTSTTPGAKIYYTVNGDEPFDSKTQITDVSRMLDGNAILYDGPLAFNEPVVIRAKAYADGYLPSSVVTHTFLSDERKINLPVFAVSVNEKYRKESRIGIWTNYNNRVMKRPSNLEFFPEMDEKADFNHQTNMEIFAASQRSNEHKQFNVIADKRYQKNKRFKYDFFDEKEGQLRKSINFRASGQDVSKTMMQDALVHVIIKDQMDIERRAYQPIVVFINGKYNGLMNLRERTQKDYIESNYGLEPHEYDLLGKHNDGYSNIRASQGTLDKWNEMISYFNTNKNNMAKDDVYREVTEKYIDEDELINYFIVQCYINNSDYPHNNIKAWRPYEGTNTRWRYILHDADLGLIYHSSRSTNRIKSTLSASSSITSKGHMGQPFYCLSKNPIFQHKFAGRYLTHAFQTFAPYRTETIVDSIANLIREEIPYTAAVHSSVKKLSEWEGYVKKLRNYWAERQPYSAGHVRDAFSDITGKTMNLKVNYDENAGDIYLNTIKLLRNFEGDYIQGLRYELDVQPKSGYTFNYWDINVNGVSTQEASKYLIKYIPTNATSVIITPVFTNSEGKVTKIAHTTSLSNETLPENQEDPKDGDEEIVEDIPVISLEVRQINIYPNPTDGLLYIQADSPIHKITFFDTSGAALKVVEHPAFPVDISSLKKGIYLVQIEMENGNIVEKVMKN